MEIFPNQKKYHNLQLSKALACSIIAALIFGSTKGIILTAILIIYGLSCFSKTQMFSKGTLKLPSLILDEEKITYALTKKTILLSNIEYCQRESFRIKVKQIDPSWADPIKIITSYYLTEDVKAFEEALANQLKSLTENSPENSDKSQN